MKWHSLHTTAKKSTDKRAAAQVVLRFPFIFLLHCSFMFNILRTLRHAIRMMFYVIRLQINLMFLFSIVDSGQMVITHVYQPVRRENRGSRRRRFYGEFERGSTYGEFSAQNF